MRIGGVAVAAITAALAAGCGSSSAETVVVMAPSSLTDVIAELDTALASGTDVEAVVAGSSTLVAQLREGATADILITADRANMDRAVGDGSVAGTPTVIAANSLVLAVAPGNPGAVQGIGDLARSDLVVGVCAAAVPCGALAGEATKALGVTVSADTEEANVRSLAAKIGLGEVDVGLVYRTDAAEVGLETVAAPELERFVNEYVIAAVEVDPDVAVEQVVAALIGSDGAALLADHGFAAAETRP